MRICNLPDCILLHVMSYLRIQDLVNAVRQTCRQWHSLSYDHSLWKHLKLDSLGDKLTDMPFLKLLESLQHVVEDIDFGFTLCLTDQSFMHQEITCSQLKSIDFSLTTISNVGLSQVIKKYPNLEGLAIHDCTYVDIYKSLESISSLRNLKSLSFDDFGCEINTDFLNNRISGVFQSCCQLESIGIDSEELYDATLQDLFKHCPAIKKVILAHCSSITVEGFLGLKSYGCNLQKIGLAYTFADDKVLKCIADNSPDLTFLDITGCIHVTDVGLSHVGDHCKRLETLIGNRQQYERGCNITNVGLQHIADGCPGLKVLDVNFCASVNDAGIIAVAEKCPDLREVGLTGCLAITDQAVMSLAKHCTKLKIIHLTECVQVTAKAVSFLISQCKWLDSLSLETCHYLHKLNLDKHLGQELGQEESVVPQELSSESLTKADIPNATGTFDGASVVGSGESSGLPISDVFSDTEPDKNLPMVYQKAFEHIDAALTHSAVIKLKPSRDPASSTAHQLLDGSYPFPLAGCDSTNIQLQTPWSPSDIGIGTHNTLQYEEADAVLSYTSHHAPEQRSVDFANITYLPVRPCHSHLKTIHLSFCSKIANDSVKQLAKHCPDLLELSLRGCYLITDGAIEVLVQSCRNLHHLDISGGSAVQSMKLTDVSLIAISKHCQRLKNLMICRNKLVTTDGVQGILHCCRSLDGMWLTVGGQFGVTFSGVLELMKSIDDRYVKITNTSQVVANGNQGNLHIALLPKRTPTIL